MTTQSSVQDWAKGQLAEMNAKVAELESKVGQLQGDARARGESALADMRARRDAFQKTLEQETARKEADARKDGESAEAAATRAKSSLETHVSAFEASAQKALSHTGAGTTHD